MVKEGIVSDSRRRRVIDSLIKWHVQIQTYKNLEESSGRTQAQYCLNEKGKSRNAWDTEIILILLL